MKKLLLILGLTITLFIGNAQKQKGVTLTVILENVLNDKGFILSALHTEETFMKAEGFHRKKNKAQKGEYRLEFKNIEPGVYAVSVLHDVNDNERMYYEAKGLPKENYALSNNPMLMGPPTFEDTKFLVGNENLDVIIRF